MLSNRSILSITCKIGQFGGRLSLALFSKRSSQLGFVAGFLALLLLTGAASAASPFTYQGRLNSPCGPATGAHDFEFGLYGSAGGSDQIGTTVTRSAVAVDDGLFSVQLDFGDGSFDAPNRWLDIAVRPGGSGNYTPLSPRQPVTPAPSAHHAFSISDGSVTAAKLAVGAVSGGTAGTISDGTVTDADLASGSVGSSELQGGAVTGSHIALGAVGPPALDPTVTQALVPSGSYIMTNNKTSPTGYTFTGRSVSPSDTGIWNGAKQPMPTARFGLAAVSLNGKIYAVGGYRLTYSKANEEYDPVTNTWATKAAMPTARTGLAAAAVNGKLYAVGGWISSPLATNEEYDPATDIWATKTAIPTARSWLAVAVVNGRLYAVGGDNGSFTSANEEYDPATNNWATKAAMPTARDYLVAAVVDDKLYAMGGSIGPASAANEEYNPTTNAWATKAPVPTARGGLAAAANNGKIYAVGGWTGSSLTSTNEEYDPTTNTWATKPPMPTARSYFAVAAVNGSLYAVGGYNGGTEYESANEEFTLPDPDSATLYVHQKD